MEEMENALATAKKSSPGPDSIPYEFIIHMPKPEKQKILNMFNQIWLEGIYPESWQQAIIIPILKPGKDPKMPSSYRPISLTCCLSKIFEKMVNLRLMWYLENKNLLVNYQMGFRKHRSTTDHLVYLENLIQNSFAKRCHAVAVSFDLEKAYDLTWRYGILQKMHLWGMRGRLPRFIQSFLHIRTFKVRVGGHLSQVYELENGVPQGSILSVTLFAIAINDLATTIDEDISKCLFVDDLLICYSAHSMNEIQETLQRAINTINEQAQQRGFRFSDSKTKSIHFCRLRSAHNEPHLTLNNTPIENVNSIKFLGMTFDKKLTWDKHIQDLILSCKTILNIIRCMSSIQWGAEKDVLLTMYKTLILSRIDYGSVVYSSARQTRLKKLDCIQNIGLRLATGAFRTSPIPVLEVEAGIPPLALRRERLMVNYATSIRTQPQHPNYSILFESNNDIYTSRPTITKPLTARLEREILSLELYEKKSSSVPPWEFTAPDLNLECAMLSKQETNHVILKNNFIQLLYNYTDAEKIYTDGSKTENGVGCAFSVGDEVHSWSLPSIASIYTAEMYAIWQALRYCEFSPKSLFLICTDSLSSLQSIRNTFNNDPLALNVLTLLHWLKQLNKNISFIFTPSHVGILGNEKADSAARSAAAHNDGVAGIPLRDKDILAETKNMYKRKWQTQWNNIEKPYKRIHPDVDTWKPPLKQSRREQTIMTRLRISHTYLTSVHLLRGEPAPLCAGCRLPLTTEHILVNCPTYTPLRQLYELGNNLQNILGNEKESMEKTLKFIKAIGLSNKI